jgi:hypothetical protein
MLLPRYVGERRGKPPVDTAKSFPDAPESDSSTRAGSSGCGLVNPSPPTQVLPLIAALFLLQRRERTRLRCACAESPADHRAAGRMSPWTLTRAKASASARRQI